MDKLIVADKGKCTRCKACHIVCPMKVINLDEDGFPVPDEKAYKLCINCGYCVDVCAFGALWHRVRKHGRTSRAALRRLEALKRRERENNNKED